MEFSKDDDTEAMMASMTKLEKIAKGIILAMHDKGFTAQEMYGALVLSWAMFSQATGEGYLSFMNTTEVTARLVKMHGYPFTKEEEDQMAFEKLTGTDED